MLSALVDFVREAIAKLDPDALFECDEARMMNVKVDTITRDKSFVWLEEPLQGTVALRRRGHPYLRGAYTTRVNLYFCRFEPMHNDAFKGDTYFSENSGGGEKRIAIRDAILRELALPFVGRLRRAGFARRYPELYESMRITYPRSRFDGNEVSVMLEFDYLEPLPCDET